MQSFFSRFLADDFTLSKRYLGILLVVDGLAMIVLMVAAEWLDPDSGGFGTIQKLGVGIGALSVVVGLTLLPLGDQPA